MTYTLREFPYVIIHLAPWRRAAFLSSEAQSSFLPWPPSEGSAPRKQGSGGKESCPAEADGVRGWPENVSPDAQSPWLFLQKRLEKTLSPGSSINMDRKSNSKTRGTSSSQTHKLL